MFEHRSSVIIALICRLLESIVLDTSSCVIVMSENRNRAPSWDAISTDMYDVPAKILPLSIFAGVGILFTSCLVLVAVALLQTLLPTGDNPFAHTYSPMFCDTKIISNGMFVFGAEVLWQIRTMKSLHSLFFPWFFVFGFIISLWFDFTCSNPTAIHAISILANDVELNIARLKQMLCCSKCIAFLAVIFLMITLLNLIFSTFLHLRNIPSPRRAALGRLWLATKVASGESADIYVEANRKYGNYKDFQNSYHLSHAINMPADFTTMKLNKNIIQAPMLE